MEHYVPPFLFEAVRKIQENSLATRKFGLLEMNSEKRKYRKSRNRKREREVVSMRNPRELTSHM